MYVLSYYMDKYHFHNLRTDQNIARKFMCPSTLVIFF